VERTFVAAATLTSKGQITIPVQVRTALGVDTGDRIEFIEIEKGQFAIVAATRSVRELNGLFHRKGRKPVSIEEMNAAIAKGASRSRLTMK
ncbi:MAG: AbrB/MazE/SpoVT family DNA-binding domain-containing protein, partial [Candidatus Sulfotelmatobacter sp.]